MKRATIKERRAVADLFAIQAGRAARGPEDIEKASLMSDSEIWDLLKENTPAAVEVEEIQPGAVPDDLFSVCNNLIKEFCDKFNLDIYKLSPLQWGAACSYCGRWFNSRSTFRMESDNFIKGSNKKIDVNAAAAAVPVWRDLCAVYNQVPLIDDFCNMVGLSYSWLWNIKSGLVVTPDDMELYKIIKQVSRDGLNKRLIDCKGSPVGAIFYSKAVEGYQESQTIKHEYIKTDASGAALPVFGCDAVQISENGEK